MKRLVIKAELFVFGRCYCAVVEREPGLSYDDLDDLAGMSFPARTRRGAERKVRRLAAKHGDTAWVVTKWTRR